MLLWKCWRDIRIAFFVGLGWLALLAVGVIQHALRAGGGSAVTFATPDQAIRLIVGFIAVQTFVFTLIALAFGTFGVGRDLGAGSGSFLLSRPIPRGYFVWTEWFSGLLGLIALLLLSVLGLWITILSHAFRVVFVTSSDGVTTQHTWTLASLPFGATAIDILCAFLFLALVFSLTHLGTTGLRHSTAGLLFSLGFLVGWLIVTAILRHEYPWMAPHIPDLLLRPFGSTLMDWTSRPAHLASSILERTAILPLFPLLAQLLLRRTEV
jgi:ABC-type transport system involved in multi-copper enzyme maturation permease subunit